MTSWTKTAAFAALLACAGASGAHAQSNPAQASRGPVAVRSVLLVNQNKEGKSIWYAFLDSNQFGLAVGCLTPGQNYVVPSSVVAYVERVGLFYIRSQVKANQTCSGATLRDSGAGPAIRLLDKGQQTVVKLN